MKWVAIYLIIGMFLTLGWNEQVHEHCGASLPFDRFIFGPIVMPIVGVPMAIFTSVKPNCQLAGLQKKIESN